MVDFSSASPFPAKHSSGWKLKADRPPDAEDEPGTRYRQILGEVARPQAHSRYIHVKQELKQLNIDYPNPLYRNVDIYLFIIIQPAPGNVGSACIMSWNERK